MGKEAGKVLILLMFVLLICFASAVPLNVNVQGKLTNTAGTALQGTYNMNFTLYDSYTSGNILWNDNYSVTTDSNGVYNVILSNVNLNFSSQYYLGIKIGSDSEMTPRLNLTSSPYAFASESLRSNGDIEIQAGSITAIYVNGTSGNVGIGTTEPNQKLQVMGIINASGKIYFDNATQAMGANAGTAGYIPQFQGSSTLNNSVIYQNGSNVGIGTTAPNAKLEVNGTGMLLNVQNAGTSYLAVNQTSGNVGIGTTGPTVKLDVEAISGTQIVGRFAFPGSSTTQNNGGTVLRIQNTDSTNGNQETLQFTDSGGSGIAAIIAYNKDHSTHSGDLAFGTRNAGTYGEAIRITNTGNVGIGTTSPEAKLEVSAGSYGGSGADTATRLLVSDDNNAGISILTPADKYAYFAFGDPGNNGIGGIFYDNGMALGLGANSLAFKTAGVYQMTILSSGNVGIGTTSPNAKLEVNGTLNVTGSSFMGDVDFNGGWENGGLSISNGDLFAQTVYVYNLTSLNINTINVNGSIIPAVGFDNTFDLGNSSSRWKDLHLGGEVYSNGSGNNYFMGNVGIGTTNPSHELTIERIDASATGVSLTGRKSRANAVITTGDELLSIRGYGHDGVNLETQGAKIVFKSTGTIATNRIPTDIQFHTSNGSADDDINQKMVIKSDGKVGIGTAAPMAKLDVRPANEAGDALRIYRGISDGYQLDYLTIEDVGGVARITASNSSVVQSMAFKVNGADRIYIKNDGNVGIGTTSPAAKLEVNGTAIFQGNFTAIGNVNITQNLSIGSSLIYTDSLGDTVIRV